MSISSEVSATRRTARVTVTRSAVIVASIAGMLISSAQTSAAQTLSPSTRKWELRVSSGALVAAGNQRNFLKDANVTAAQVSWLALPSLAVTGTFGWARSRDVAAVNAPKLDVFTSDLGVEARGAQWFAGRAVSFSPFVGVGGGVRSYNYRKLDVDATNNIAGYAAIGGELGIHRVGLRVELRDYATGFKPLTTIGKSDARNDVVIMAALRFNRRASQN